MRDSHRAVPVLIVSTGRTGTRFLARYFGEHYPNIEAHHITPRSTIINVLSNMQLGGLITEQWLDAEVVFPSDRIRIVDRAEDQAFAATHYLSQLGDQFAHDEITIGIPDHDVEPVGCDEPQWVRRGGRIDHQPAVVDRARGQDRVLRQPELDPSS